MKIRILCICAALPMFFAASCAENRTEDTTPTDTSVEVIAPAKSADEHIFDISKLITDENGFLTYSDEQVYSLKGIDVSSYSGDIDWETVSESGVEFAMIRLGGRGYGDSGALYTDEKARYNIDEAKKNGIQVGGYFFSQATTEDEAIEEAEYALEIVGDSKLDLPIAYDFEHIKDDDARTDNVTDEEIQKFADAFGQVMLDNYYVTMVYTEDENVAIYKESEALRWVAKYDDTLEIDDTVKIWQYSKDGTVDGISGSVDLDIMFMGRWEY